MMTRKRKAYRPRPSAVEYGASLFRALTSAATVNPLPSSVALSEAIKARSSLSEIAAGRGSDRDFDRVGYAINVADALCRRGIGGNELATIQCAVAVMYAISPRVPHSASAEEVAVLAAALEVYEAQIEVCPTAMLTAVIAEQWRVSVQGIAA